MRQAGCCDRLLAGKGAGGMEPAAALASLQAITSLEPNERAAR